MSFTQSPPPGPACSHLRIRSAIRNSFCLFFFIYFFNIVPCMGDANLQTRTETTLRCDTSQKWTMDTGPQKQKKTGQSNWAFATEFRKSTDDKESRPASQ